MPLHLIILQMLQKYYIVVTTHNITDNSGSVNPPPFFMPEMPHFSVLSFLHQHILLSISAKKQKDPPLTLWEILNRSFLLIDISCFATDVSGD